MKRISISIYFCAALVAFSETSIAQDVSKKSEAKPWNLAAEVPARFEAKVVDLLCEIAGECSADCGGGTRQLGLLRASDNALVFPNKNSQPAFSGAAYELADYCGKDVEVDGLMIEDPEFGVKNVYLVQKIRTVDEPKWIKANSWTKKWAKRHPDAKGKGPWFRRDPRVTAKIAKDGHLGLGLETDETFIKEWFE